MPQNIHVKSTVIALNSYVDHDASRSTYWCVMILDLLVGAM